MPDKQAWVGFSARQFIEDVAEVKGRPSEYNSSANIIYREESTVLDERFLSYSIKLVSLLVWFFNEGQNCREAYNENWES